MSKWIGYCQNNKQEVHPTVDQTSQRFRKIRGYNPLLTTDNTQGHLITIKDPHIFRACGKLISHQNQTHTSQMLKIFQIKTKTPNSRISARDSYTFNKSDINTFVKFIN